MVIQLWTYVYERLILYIGRSVWINPSLRKRHGYICLDKPEIDVLGNLNRSLDRGLPFQSEFRYEQRRPHRRDRSAIGNKVNQQGWDLQAF